MDIVLLVEDEARIRDIVRDYFTSHGLQCDLARDGQEALEMLKAQDYDAVIMDVLMPRMDGFSLCRAIRAKSIVPILFLTALSGEADTLQGYALGCDDYVAKPFSLAVLLAKTQALIRRGRGDSGAILTCGAVAVDESRRTCTVGGAPVKLSPREFDLLLCLMRNRGQVMTREQLLNKVWGMDFEGADRAVDTRIRSLRAALGSAGSQIKTLYGTGYKMEDK